MRGFSLRPNLVFNWDSAAFRIDRLPPGDSVLIERVEDGEYKIVKKDELLQEFSAGRISMEQVADSVTKSRTYSRPMTDIPESLRNEVRRRLTYLRALEAQGGPLFTPAFTRPISLQIAEQMGDKTPPSATTLYRWHCLYRQANDSASLLPRIDRRGSRMLRQSERVLQLAEEAIEEAFLTSPKAGANAGSMGAVSSGNGCILPVTAEWPTSRNSSIVPWRKRTRLSSSVWCHRISKKHLLGIFGGKASVSSIRSIRPSSFGGWIVLGSHLNR